MVIDYHIVHHFPWLIIDYLSRVIILDLLDVVWLVQVMIGVVVMVVH